MRHLLIAGLCLMPGVAWAERKSPEVQLREMQDYCYRSDASMAEGRDCMSKQADRIRREIDKEVRKRYFEIGEVEKAKPDDPAPRGKDDANKWRASFKKEQSSWEIYQQTRCENVINFENAGGSGAGGFATNCSIRLMLERLRELQVGY